MSPTLSVGNRTHPHDSRYCMGIMVPMRSPGFSSLACSFLSLILQVASNLPKRSLVSKETVAVKVSSLPESFRSFGTRHEYPQVPPQPKGIVPSTTFFPEELVMTTVGSSEA